AHAGLIRTSRTYTLASTRRLRACGADPLKGGSTKTTSAVVPAHAGLIRAGDEPRNPKPCRPRACGAAPSPANSDCVYYRPANRADNGGRASSREGSVTFSKAAPQRQGD